MILRHNSVQSSAGLYPGNHPVTEDPQCCTSGYGPFELATKHFLKLQSIFCQLVKFFLPIDQSKAFVTSSGPHPKYTEPEFIREAMPGIKC